MAKKRNTVESSSDSVGSEELTTQTQITKKPKAAMKPSASKQPQPLTSSESESDSDGGPDLVPTQAMEKSGSKSSAADPVKSAAKKRPAEDTDAKKKSKNRVWTETDEIAILQGMVDYWVEKNADPTADYDAFLECIKEKLIKKDSDKTQLRGKINKLKKKYKDNLLKEEEKEKEGEEMTFSNPHEQQLFDLSKCVWGTDKEEEAAKEDYEAVKSMERVGADKNGKGDAAADREKEWKKLFLEEMQTILRALGGQDCTVEVCA